MPDPTDLIRRGDAITAAAKVEQPPYPRPDAGEAAIYAIGFTAGRKAVEVALRALPAPVVPAEGLAAAMERLQTEICCADGDRADAAQDHSDGSERVDLWPHTAEFDVDDVRMVLTALRSAPPVGARVTAQDDAAAFDKADWFWRTMDPDDCGDSPEEAINRAMVGQFCVCEIASSYRGPTRYGFIAPVLDPESDDEEFVHFATQQEAVDAAKARRAALLPAGEVK